ncbi:hypothetical protein [Prevotella sp. oral taxon 376]|uniref:hypothetical protein n=1 Tax=Prevotella sp. oral taxon 376 TaxID=712466 RepID=UPI001304A8DB|nr:hypothetical protein [Prevotella sp. oral taxon 376]
MKKLVKWAGEDFLPAARHMADAAHLTETTPTAGQGAIACFPGRNQSGGTPYGIQ